MAEPVRKQVAVCNKNGGQVVRCSKVGVGLKEYNALLERITNANDYIHEHLHDLELAGSANLPTQLAFDTS